MDRPTIEAAVRESVSAVLSRLSPAAVLEMRGMDSAVTDVAQRALITHLLVVTGRNQLKTARILGLNRTTLRSRMRRYGLLPANGRHA